MKTKESETVRRPRRWSNTELNRVGVEVVDPHCGSFLCQECGSVWSPDIQTGGRMPRGWWRCPRGCHEGLETN